MPLYQNITVTPFMTLIGLSAATTAVTTNQIRVYGFILPNTTTVNNIVVSVSTADATNPVDFGIYDSGGNLKCHIGATTMGTTGVKDTAVLVATTLAPGKYYFAMTQNGTTPAILIRGNSSSAGFANGLNSVTASSGAVLPGTISIPADSWTTLSTMAWAAFH